MSTQSIHNIQIICPYIKSMKIQNTPQPTKAPPISTPPIYLLLWQQSTKKEGDLVLSWRRRGLHARSGGELSGGVIGVVVRPVVVDRRGLLLDRSRRSSRSSWCSGSSWRGDDRGVRRRSRRDGSQVWLCRAHDGRTEHLRL